MRMGGISGTAMRKVLTLLVIPLVGGAVLGQSSGPTPQPQTFHVKGRIKSSSGYDVDGARISFEGEKTRVVPSDKRGFYEADLPLGDYAMTVTSPVFMACHRPLFRVASPMRLTFDFVLHPIGLATDVPLNPTDPAVRASVLYDISPYGEEFFPVPSGDGVQFQLYIRYSTQTRGTDNNTYAGDSYPPYQNRVFVAYNLFSMWADKVMYNERSRTIEAHDNVCVAEKSGALHCDYSATFKIEDGQVTKLK
jgi:hypothetical protein